MTGRRSLTKFIEELETVRDNVTHITTFIPCRHKMVIKMKNSCTPIRTEGRSKPSSARVKIWPMLNHKLMVKLMYIADIINLLNEINI